jgi:uncharacterized membrane protein
MKNYIISIIVLLILDIIWISLYMGKQYQKQINNIQNNVLIPKYTYAIFAYFLMTIGLIQFVIPNIKKENRLCDSFKYGFIFGLIVYGIYDFTCAAIFKDWDIKLAFIDVIWGGFVYFIASYIGSFFIKN